MAAAVPVAKLVSLAAKQISKPVSKALVTRARSKQDGLIRYQCVTVGRFLNWTQVIITRLSAGRAINEWHVVRTEPYWPESIPASSSSSAATEGDVTKEAEEVKPDEPAGRLNRGTQVSVIREGLGPIPGSTEIMMLVEWGKSGQRQRGWIAKEAGEGLTTLRFVEIKEMPEEEALETGSAFVAEFMVFGVAAAFTIQEYLKSRREKEQAKIEKRERQAAKEKERSLASAERDSRLDLLERSVRELLASRAALEQTSEELELALVKTEAKLATSKNVIGWTLATATLIGAFQFGSRS
eukprot:TRINITY_DN7822_c2_g3_i1.p1 TRINITY_DN7822_c2_g3~~TRINITY_DN7822_c2_g3_i1.p1  ORF type:complete len:305 (+),score=68.02 TRINITY_DN7822_c2_g3_i1:27-917(+)